MEVPSAARMPREKCARTRGLPPVPQPEEFNMRVSVKTSWYSQHGPLGLLGTGHLARQNKTRTRSRPRPRPHTRMATCRGSRQMAQTWRPPSLSSSRPSLRMYTGTSCSGPQPPDTGAVMLLGARASALRGRAGTRIATCRRCRSAFRRCEITSASSLRWRTSINRARTRSPEKPAGLQPRIFGLVARPRADRSEAQSFASPEHGGWLRVVDTDPKG